MNTFELQTTLVSIDTPSHAYSLKGGLPNEAYCLDDTGTGWEVYYSEIGNKNRMAFFAHESEACHYFLDVIKKHVLPYYSRRELLPKYKYPGDKR